MTLHTRINNECPRRYANRCEAQRKIHTKGHLSLSCSGCVKFSGFQCSKTSANKRLLLCLLPSAADVQTSPGAGSRCKGNQLFWIEQEKSNFEAIFLV